MYYLIYYAYESKPFTTKGLEELLYQARERNALYKLTGKLLYVEGTFIQLLEGEKSAVHKIYSSIEKDNRLIAIKLVAEGETKSRHFPNWSMAFDKITLDDINEFEKCEHPRVKEYLEQATPFRLLKLMVNNPLL